MHVGVFVVGENCWYLIACGIKNTNLAFCIYTRNVILTKIFRRNYNIHRLYIDLKLKKPHLADWHMVLDFYY